MKRFDVEMLVDEILDDIREEYADLESDFYGDCYPNEIMEIENRLEMTDDEEEIEDYKREIRDVFMSYVNSMYCVIYNGCFDESDELILYPSEEEAITESKKIMNDNIHNINVTKYVDFMRRNYNHIYLIRDKWHLLNKGEIGIWKKGYKLYEDNKTKLNVDLGAYVWLKSIADNKRFLEVYEECMFFNELVNDYYNQLKNGLELTISSTYLDKRDLKYKNKVIKLIEHVEKKYKLK